MKYEYVDSDGVKVKLGFDVDELRTVKCGNSEWSLSTETYKMIIHDLVTRIKELEDTNDVLGKSVKEANAFIDDDIKSKKIHEKLAARLEDESNLQDYDKPDYRGLCRDLANILRSKP